MKGGVGSHLKALAYVLVFTVLLLSAFTCTQQGKAYADANLSAYMSVVCPNWEPMGYNATGTAPWLDVQTLGWNAVKIGGNVGIGDGSYRTLKNTSTPDGKYADTGSEMMAADISMAPLDISRMSGYIPPVTTSTATNETAAQNNTTATNKTGQAMLSIPAIDAPHFDKNVSEAANNTNASEANNTVSASPAPIGGNMALNDPYHSILMGRPINDLLYEDPLSFSVTAYGRLVGFQLPGGCVNVGIRCLGYGY
jgi:hypothetical protein